MQHVPQQRLIEEVATDLKGKLTKPEWADYVKTGSHKQRPPLKDDWWYTRAAAVLRTVHLKGPIGVAKLRTKFGGAKNRGVKPDRFEKSGGSIIRHALQQLEHAGLIKQADRGVHKGRVTTPAGAALLVKAAKRVETLPSLTKKAPAEKAHAPKPAVAAPTPKKEKQDKPKAAAPEASEN
jgi:small subunit ribosomal protein S19e